MPKESTVSAPQVATCRICGCTEERACEGGCSWVSDPEGIGDLCSKCLTNPQHIWEIPLEQIRPAPWNPPDRLIPDPEMADSINKEGQKQNALLRLVDDEPPVRFEIVFGHRRYAARKLLSEKVDAALGVLRCEIEEMNEERAMILTAIENLQRKDYTVFQEAEFFKVCSERFGDSAVKTLSERLSLREGYIRKRLRFLELPQLAIDFWKSGAWHIGHLEQLLRVGDQVEGFMQELGKRQWDNPAELTIRQLKEKVDRLAVPLHSGRFDKAECKTCPKNTDVQRKLFDTEKEKTKCLDQTCFLEKQQAWLDINWPTCKSNRFGTQTAIIGDYNAKVTGEFSSYGHNDVTPGEKCKSCPKFASVVNLQGEQQFSSKAKVCLGQNECFAEVKAASKKNLGAGKGKSNKADADAPRVPWHGEHFRQEFYATEIPRLLENLSEDDGRRLQIALTALVYSSAEMHEWFCIKAGVRLPEKEEWQTYANRLPLSQLLDAARGLGPRECENWLAEAVAKMAIDKCSYQTVFTDQDRQTLAEFLDVDFGRYQVTDEYLQKKTKAELVRFIVHDSGLMEEAKFQEFMVQRGYPTAEKLAQAKKGALVELILQCQVDLRGRLPKEIADRPKLRANGE